MKRYIPIIFLLVLLIGLGIAIQEVRAEDTVKKGYEMTIVKDYPELKACRDATTGDNKKCVPGEKGFGLPQFIKYVYIFGIGLVGFVGLIAVMMGAFGYITSTGNPQKASDAKDKIFAALFGMLLLLGSVVILNLINPDLLQFSTKELPTVDISVSTDQPIPECHGVSASWDKGKISAGQSADLILTFSKECGTAPQIEWDKAYLLGLSLGDKPALRQERPNGFNPICNIYFKSDGAVKGLTITYAVTFNGQCRDKANITECLFGGKICNFLEDKPELFYAEGAFYIIKGADKYKQFIPRLEITVEDGK